MKAPLRYFGSKWRIAEWVVAQLPPHDCYVEVFGGSAAVLMVKARAGVEVYNDLDGDVVAFFKTLREHPSELAQLAALTPFARSEHELSFEPTDDPIERARRFLVRSWMTRGGYRRTGHSSWWYQVNIVGRQQTAAVTWSHIPQRLGEVAQRLTGVHIECADWREVLRRFDGESTLFYLDPPYIGSTRSARWEYRHEFSDQDHEELLDAVSKLRGAVALSGYRHPMYARLGWQCRTTTSNTQTGECRDECLWLSRPASRQLELFGA